MKRQNKEKRPGMAHFKKSDDIFNIMTYRCELECSKLNHTTTHSQHFVIWGDQDREGTTDNDYKNKYRQQHKTLNINHMFKIQSVKNNIVQFVFSILWKSSNSLVTDGSKILLAPCNN